jgi:hypothetical protein
MTDFAETIEKTIAKKRKKLAKLEEARAKAVRSPTPKPNVIS